MSFYDAGKPTHSAQTVLYSLIALLSVGLWAVLMKIGLLEVLPLLLLLLITAITPMLMNRYEFFLFLWLFIAPSCDNLRQFLIAGANPVVFAITGISVPFALILLIRDFKKVVRDFPFVLYLFIFTLITFLSLFRPEVEKNVFLEFLKLVIEIFVIFCAYHTFKAGRGPALFQKVNIFIILNSLIALLQRLTGIGLDVIEGLPRVNGLVGHPNVLAFVNLLYLPFGIYQMMRSTSQKDKTFWLVGIILSTIVIFLTLCKNVILALGFDLAVLFLFLPNKLKFNFLIVSLVGILVFFGINELFGLHFTDQFMNRVHNTGSLTWRLKVWRYLMESIGSDNILFGHGGNSVRLLLPLISPSKNGLEAHNGYLQLIYEYGLTSLFFLMAFLHPAVHFLKQFLIAPNQTKIYNILPVLILCSILINMASDNSAFLRTPMDFAWIFLLYIYMNEKKTINEL